MVNRATQLLKIGLQAAGANLERFSLFDRAVGMIAAHWQHPFFVQIGANNGIDFDNMYSKVERYILPGIVVEPVSYYHDSLVEAYKRHRNVTPVKAALHPTRKDATIYWADPAKIRNGWEAGLASFSRDHLVKFGVDEDAVLAETVPCMTFDQLIERYAPGKKISILAMDTEGFDAEILRMVCLERHRPEVVKFEAKHLSASDLSECVERLRSARYFCERWRDDVVAVQQPLQSRLAYFLSMSMHNTD